MEKTITIDGQEVKFKSTAATPLRYKAQFKKDFFSELIKISKLNDALSEETIELLDMDVFYNIIWTLAKTADNSIPDPLSWLDRFETFPIIEILPELQDLIISSMQTIKKK